MATAAFRSNTKRSAFPGADASKPGARHRRSRSLSRPSGRLPVSDEVVDADFPEISLDDLADEMFQRTEEEDDEVRPGVGWFRGRDADLGHRAETGSSRTRRRSVSRTREPAGGEWERKGVAEGRARRQRSVSVTPRDRQRGSEVIVTPEPTTTVNGDDSHSTSSNDIKTVAEVRRSYNSKLEQSEKRRQELLAKLAFEEHRGQELTKIVRKLPHAPKHAARAVKPSGLTKRQNDKIKTSKQLDEEAEKIFEDFLSSIDDTDISSYDGERSETSSMIGGSARLIHAVSQNCTNGNTASAPVKADGVVLPWLHWEANYPSPSKPKMHAGSEAHTTLREGSAASYNSNCFASSRGSWSPEANDSCSAVSPATTCVRAGESESAIVGRPVVSSIAYSFDMDEYVELQHREELLFEILRQRQRIDTGSLILCWRGLS